jgi:hypothetical protein
MFKDIQRGFEKFFTTQRVIVLIIFIVIAWALLSYSGSKGSVHDLMSTGHSAASVPSVGLSSDALPSSAGSPSSPSSPSGPATPSGKGYALQPVANPADLLPQDQNSQWSALNPNAMNKGDILMPDLLQAGYHIGLDTIGQTLRNPNLQLRSDPLIPKSDIGPWNQSTIEPDIGRVPLEIGQ